jgi:hypothetical protein
MDYAGLKACHAERRENGFSSGSRFCLSMRGNNVVSTKNTKEPNSLTAFLRVFLDHARAFYCDPLPAKNPVVGEHVGDQLVVRYAAFVQLNGLHLVA